MTFEKAMLLEHDIHIWQVQLDSPETEITGLRKRLSPDELVRADKFYYPLHQSLFIVMRAALRCLIGKYLGMSASDINFQYNRFGKPGILNLDEISFNVSHSAHLGIIAFSSGDRQIGIDLERIRFDMDCKAIAVQNFSQNEKKVIESLSGSELYNTFFPIGYVKKPISKHGVKAYLLNSIVLM